MSSPSKPVNIRQGPQEFSPFQSSPVGTPDLRALRHHYVGTPPLPNIPVRNTPGTRTPVVGGLGTPFSRPVIDVSSSPRITGGSLAVGGLTASHQPTHVPTDIPILDLDELPDEDKARVLARLLVSKEERAKADNSKSAPESDASTSHSRPISQHSGGNAREESEPFPIPYDAPGADIT